MDEKEELEEIYQKMMEETGESQISVTNADERFMKNGFAVSYNLPKAVDLENHLTRYFKMANQVAIHGLLGPTMEGILKEDPERILEITADKGYEQEEDLICCLENVITPI